MHTLTTSCPCRAVPRHNAHQFSVTVVYPWHPLAGRELVVCGRVAHAGVASYLVTLPDDTKAALPIWMTEASAARDAELRDIGVASLAALEAARMLVDEVRAAWARSSASATNHPEPTTSGETS